MEMVDVISFMKQGVELTLLIGLPLLLTRAITGVLVGTLLSAMQISDQTATFVCKIIAVALVFVWYFPWCVSKFADFCSDLWTWTAK